MISSQKSTKSAHLRERGVFWRLCIATIMVLTNLLPFSGVLAASTQAPLAQTTLLKLNVVSARTEGRHPGGAVAKGEPVTDFKYIINIDNTGTTEQRNANPGSGCSPSDAGYPDSCHWVSVAGAKGYSPVYAQGDQDDFAGAGLNLPNGRYLISVLADGFKLDGAHFSVPFTTADPVKVELQPFPLPDATLRAFVFQDEAIPNGAPDVPVEEGLAGFSGHLADYLGEVTTDIYGNPLCTRYVGEDPTTFIIPNSALDTDQLPVPIDGTGGQCLSDSTGMLAIPHLGTNRYALTVIPPNGQNWIQTTTLEGNHDWDSWIMEGHTGYDTEFVVAGEPFPAIIFGFVKPKNNLPAAGGHTIHGTVAIARVYVPAKGGLGLPGTIWGGMTGAKLDGPISEPWVALTDLTNGDQAVWVGQGDANGNFSIPHVPDGNYTLTWWDEPQNYILDLINVTVNNGDINMGILPLTGWWTKYDGYVFNDLNRNGKRDPGEPGVPNFALTMRKRENSQMDRGGTAVTTDANGYYSIDNGYPMTQWLVLEAYDSRYYTTGITYQSDNQTTPTTVKGAGVDLSVLPIIGLSGHVEWGVHFYDPTGASCNPVGSYENCLDPRNGGIVGTISYDTTRNEFDPQYAAIETWQPSIPDMIVNLYAPVDCNPDGSAPCDVTGRYQLDANGAYAHGTKLNTYLSETWERPKGCVARDVDSNPLINGVDEQVLPLGSSQPNNTQDCLEGPLMGNQFGAYATDQGTPDANFGAAVNGNYGFGDGCFDGSLDANDPSNPTCAGGFQPLPAGDYLVEVVSPQDEQGQPIYKPTREEDINIANGDMIIPQVPPPACAGALHTVDVANDGTVDNYAEVVGDGNNGLPVGVVVPASQPVDNATILDIGGTPYEGMQRPSCDTKLVELKNGKSIAPGFNYFTDVPIPGRFWGLIVDDLNFSSNPKSLLYGEKAGVPFAPVGIYDYADRLVTTVESDFNGLFDVLLPSTNRINCPTPSGVCSNLYRFVGNDPGIPGRLNLNYKPAFRTIAAEFEAFAGLLVPADLAPTQVGVTVQLPGGQTNTVSCALDTTTPQLLAVSKPYADIRNNSEGSFTVTGSGFGANVGQVLLDGNIPLPTTFWSDGNLSVRVPATTPVGAHQLSIKSATGQSTINGLTFHVLGRGTAPAFPSNAVLDNFNRSTPNNNISLGNNWGGTGGGGGGGGGGGSFTIPSLNPSTNPSNQVRVTGNGGNAYWNANGNNVFGADQEAYFTFKAIPGGNRQEGLLLKVNTGGGGGGGGNINSFISVRYNASASSVVIATATNGVQVLIPNVRATIPSVTFAVGDVLGARTYADGTVNVYKNGNLIGTTNVAAGAATLVAGGGRIGVSFVAPLLTNFNTPNDARFDDFGGGTINSNDYLPTVYEVGPGKTFDTIPNAPVQHTIQRAIDAALASPGNDLVVVYPGAPDLVNPRANPRGAYYENLIITGPLKLQGVGPGGFQGTTFIPGSIIDGSAFGGDTLLANDWRTKIASLIDGEGVPTWLGNPNINDGEVIYMLAFAQNPYGSAYKASIDGFDLRGGDQQGFPTNINVVGGGPTNLPANVVTQGGAIFANAYVRNLQITNNVVQNNGGGYGTLRIGTPDIAAPDTNQHNENVRIVNNRIIANGGTNLAGGIGLFAGADNYDVGYNDICGNFSAEYGGGISVYGLSPNGKIHHNRIFFNSSYDEGGGIMIAGELPANAGTLSPGTGSVEINANLIQANLGNDDGGGVRFLMAGNYPMTVTNNIIVNNVSTHEGGGISLNDAPDVRVINNTIMKNLTTATAVTSNGQPAPAGLSTSLNSDMLQATLPVGSPTFSNPKLFNNIFRDNRAGTRNGTGVLGLDVTGADYWDLGDADGFGTLSPTNSIIQQPNVGVKSYTSSPTNLVDVDPNIIANYDTTVAFSVWRNNPNFVGAVLVAVDLPPNLMGNYHLKDNTSPAFNTAAASNAGLNAPSTDIDSEPRPLLTGFDIGADEYPGLITDLNISKTDNQTSATRGTQVTYVIVVSNAGPNAVSQATVTDNVPAALTNVTWTCTATAGSSCPAGGSGNTINTTVNLLNGGAATFTVVGTLPLNAANGTLDNTASVAVALPYNDLNPANNSATDSDTITNPLADLAISKTDNKSSATAGTAVNYTIVITNNGPNAVSGATMVDTLPAVLTVNSWSCTSSSGSLCSATGSGLNRSGIVTLTVGGTATFVANTTLATNAIGTLVNNASVTPPVAVQDNNLSNNSASDSDSIIPALPTLGLLDNFTRGNANTLGSNWSQLTILNSSAIRVNSNQAFANNAGAAYWNAASFGATQGVSFTLASGSTNNGVALILKASGTQLLGIYPTYLRVRYDTGNGGQVIVDSTTTGGITYSTLGTFSTAGAMSTGDSLTALANADGSVDVWKTSAANVTTYLGHSNTSSTFTGGGRIGIQLPNNTRVDNFSGGNVSTVVAVVAAAAELLNMVNTGDSVADVPATDSNAQTEENPDNSQGNNKIYLPVISNQ